MEILSVSHSCKDTYTDALGEGNHSRLAVSSRRGLQRDEWERGLGIFLLRNKPGYEGP
jgi:hypothetical protein